MTDSKGGVRPPFAAKAGDAASDEERAAPRIVVDDRYQLLSVLARGGMGTVWEATHLRLHRPVALKLLSHPLPTDHVSVRRFVREARIAASLEHDHCVRVLDFGVDPWAGHYLVMELLRGTTLEDELSRGGRQKLGSALQWLAPVASALDAVHGLGLVHRDVKPANIFLASGQEGGVVKLVDFGLATHVDGRTSITERGVLLGTPRYLAPEVVRGAPATPASDVYSLGVVAYESVTGQLPHEHDALPALMAAKMVMRPRSLGETTGQMFNARVEDAFAAALAADPAERTPSAGAFVEQLHFALDASRASHHR